MRVLSNTVLPIGTLVLVIFALAFAPPSFAFGRAPSASTCKEKPASPIVQGGCIVINRAQGNCAACHVIAGTSMDGNIGPELRNVRHMVPNKQALFNQIWDAQASKPHSAMPPFGKNRILTRQQIEKVVDFLWTI